MVWKIYLNILTYLLSSYLFEEKKYGKARLVEAVVRSWSDKNVGLTLAQLQKLFPGKIQGKTYGIVENLDNVHEKISKRYFTKENEIIVLADCRAVVCSQWGTGNIVGFLNHVKEMGIVIKQV